MAGAISPSAAQQLSPSLKADLDRSVLEGGLNTIFGTLIGGSFLVGFALALGATDAHIGLLSALPPLLNLVQIVGSYLVNRVGSPKRVCVTTAALYRVAWMGILLIPFAFLNTSEQGWAVLILMAALGLSSFFASLSGVAWMAWVAELVPQAIRGKFFGYRNMVAGGAGMIAALAAGQFVDYWEKLFPTHGKVFGFSVLFTVGILFGIWGWIVMRRISDVSVPQATQDSDFFRSLRKPLQDARFRRWTIFSSLWALAVGVGSPFFTVYMLKVLEMPFSLIAVFSLVSGITNIIGMRLWGNLIDEVGSKPLLLVCSLAGAVIPLLWLFSTKDSYGILWFVHIVSGLAWSGVGLASSHLLMSSAPREGASTYFAVFAGITGLSGAAAPILGGVVAALTTTVTLQVAGVAMEGLQIVFVLTGILRIATLVLLRTIPDADSMPTSEFLAKLRSLTSYQLVRTGQQLAVMGTHSAEATLGHIAAGSLQMERMVSEVLDKGEVVARIVRRKSERIDTYLDRRVLQWERMVDRAAEGLLKWAKAVHRFLSEDGSDDS